MARRHEDRPSHASAETVADEEIEIAKDEPPADAAVDQEAPEGMARRQVAGLLLGPVAALLLYWLMSNNVDELGNDACIVAAVTLLMATWWMTEAIPLAATALLPLALFPILGVGEIEDVAAPYASDTVFLFLGGFILALTMQRWNLHRRVAFRIVLLVGTQPRRLVGGFMLAAGLLGMWVSGTATTMMMLPMGLSVLTLLKKDGVQVDRNFSVCLMLGIAYAAVISSTSTIVATPGNAFAVAYMAENHDVRITFVEWMAVGTPLSAVLLVIAWFVLTRVVYPPQMGNIPGGVRVIREQFEALGAMSRGEKTIGIVFLTTAASWIFIPLLGNWEPAAEVAPWLENITESGIAVCAALVCFLIPVHPKRDQMLMRWEDAKDVPWGILLLFGGGLSLSAFIIDTGLSSWLGDQVATLEGMSTLVIVSVVTGLVLVLTEFTSTTATIATYVPVMAGIAVGIGLDPLLLVLPTAFTASCVFMLPCGTPPNAIAIGSGYVTIGQMVRAGVWLNLAALVLVVVATMTLGVWVFGLSP